MTAAVETMAYAKDRGVPWHGLGTPADGLMTAAEVLEKAELDWTVEAQPLYIDPPGGGLKDLQLVQTHRAIVRQTDHQILGVVGNRYTPVQNAEALAILDGIVDDGGAKYDTAGSLWGGRRVFMSMELPQHISVRGDSSDYLSYIVAANSHDGWSPFKILRTDVRVVCSNTLQAAESKALAKFSARHTASVGQRIGEMRDALALEFKNLESLNDLFNKMAATRISKARGEEILAKVFPLTDAEKGSEVRQAQSDFAAALENWRSTETLSDKLRGTNFGLYNAIAEFTDWGMTFRGEAAEDNRVGDILFGSAGRVNDAKRRALALLKP